MIEQMLGYSSNELLLALSLTVLYHLSMFLLGRSDD